MEELLLCHYCKSFVDGKCTDCFEPGICFACINYLEKNNEDRPDNNQR